MDIIDVFIEAEGTDLIKLSYILENGILLPITSVAWRRWGIRITSAHRCRTKELDYLMLNEIFQKGTVRPQPMLGCAQCRSYLVSPTFARATVMGRFLNQIIYNLPSNNLNFGFLITSSSL